METWKSGSSKVLLGDKLPAREPHTSATRGSVLCPLRGKRRNASEKHRASLVFTTCASSTARGTPWTHGSLSPLRTNFRYATCKFALIAVSPGARHEGLGRRRTAHVKSPPRAMRQAKPNRFCPGICDALGAPHGTPARGAGSVSVRATVPGTRAHTYFLHR